MKLDKKDLRNIEDDIYKTNEIERIVKNNLYDAIIAVGEGHITLDEITRHAGIQTQIHDVSVVK